MEANTHLYTLLPKEGSLYFYNNETILIVSAGHVCWTHLLEKLQKARGDDWKLLLLIALEFLLQNTNRACVLKTQASIDMTKQTHM